MKFSEVLQELEIRLQDSGIAVITKLEFEVLKDFKRKVERMVEGCDEALALIQLDLFLSGESKPVSDSKLRLKNGDK